MQPLQTLQRLSGGALLSAFDEASWRAARDDERSEEEATMRGEEEATCL
jgi:hypothetical protein